MAAIESTPVVASRTICVMGAEVEWTEVRVGTEIWGGRRLDAHPCTERPGALKFLAGIPKLQAEHIRF
jgi:hypothetical protein